MPQTRLMSARFLRCVTLQNSVPMHIDLCGYFLGNFTTRITLCHPLLLMGYLLKCARMQLLPCRPQGHAHSVCPCATKPQKYSWDLLHPWDLRHQCWSRLHHCSRYTYQCKYLMSVLQHQIFMLQDRYQAIHYWFAKSNSRVVGSEIARTWVVMLSEVAWACLKNWSRSAVSCPFTRSSCSAGSSGGSGRTPSGELSCSPFEPAIKRAQAWGRLMHFSHTQHLRILPCWQQSLNSTDVYQDDIFPLRMWRKAKAWRFEAVHSLSDALLGNRGCQALRASSSGYKALACAAKGWLHLDKLLIFASMRWSCSSSASNRPAHTELDASSPWLLRYAFICDLSVCDVSGNWKHHAKQENWSMQCVIFWIIKHFLDQA